MWCNVTYRKSAKIWQRMLRHTLIGSVDVLIGGLCLAVIGSAIGVLIGFLRGIWIAFWLRLLVISISPVPYPSKIDPAK